MGTFDVKLSFPTQVEESGRPGATPVLLLHDGAWGADAIDSWDPITRSLGGDYHVLAPDLLGYGASAKAVRFDTDLYTQRAEQLRALCAAKFSEPPHVVGTSFGGSLALYCAAARVFPMRSCTSISGTVSLWRDPRSQAFLASKAPTPAYLRELVELLAPGQSRDAIERQVARRWANITSPGGYAVIASRGMKHELEQPAPRQFEFPAALATVDVPVHFVRGTRDTTLLPDWAERFREHVPASVTSLDSGHCPNLSHPREVEEALRSIFV